MDMQTNLHKKIQTKAEIISPGHTLPARTWALIHMDALTENVRAIRQLLPKSCAFMAVVKANAYGHGDIMTAHHLARIGVSDFAVATIEEGITLRKHKIPGNILILGYTPAACAHMLIRYDLTQTIVDPEHARALADTRLPIKVHIKIDTGMHRLGVSCDDFHEVVQLLTNAPFQVTGMFTHLCCADSKAASDVQYTRQQIARFYALISQLQACQYPIPPIHIQSSYGVVNYPGLPCDYARIGIMMYGCGSSAEAHPELKLCPVLSLHSRVASIRKIKAGEPVGYGRTFISDSAKTLATIPIGYGDGYPRALSGQGYVLIRGRRAPIVGRICMDQLTVDISDIQGVHHGDKVTLIGSDGDEQITAEEIAGLAGTITNELLCRLGTRIRRIAVA